MKSSMKLTKKEIFSIPNILCYFRILLIPVFMISYINAKETRDYYFAAFIVLLSGLTDFADGFIARHFNMVTELGKAIDPVADKLSQAAIVISLMIRIEPMRWLFLLFAVKELFMGNTSIVLLTKHNTKMDGAKWFGKVSTFVFYTVMFIIIVFPSLDVGVRNILILISGLFLLLAFLLYAQVFLKMYQETQKKK